MSDYESIGGLVKRFAKCRNKTLLQLSKELGIKYTTFNEQINRGTLRADTLFKLAGILDMDLNWMASVLEYQNYNNVFDRALVPRMQHDFRMTEKEHIEQNLKKLLKEIPDSTSQVRVELLKSYSNNMAYLLDVLIPEEFSINLYADRKGYKYFVDTNNNHINSKSSYSSRRKSINMLYSGNEALDIMIKQYKGEC